MPRKINGKPFSQVFLCRHATAKGEAPWPKEAWGANYATDRRWKNL